ncbi:MAG TPA: hypothetical protein VMB49_18445 [Acidobacteriaceae bacterium]|nr:hypothetical protein [Acidobacteriaceae bacterium]
MNVMEMEIEEEVMDAVAEGPREKLRQILERNGEGLLQDPDRVEGLLRDHCGSYRKEISALVGALNERVPLELKGSWQTAMTPEAMRARLVQRMEDNRGLAPEVAEWAVDSWSYALGIGLGRRSDRVQSSVLGSPSQFNRNGSANGAIGQADFSGNYAGGIPSDRVRSDAERRAAIASDRPGGSAGPGAGLLANADQKKKVGIGAGALLLVAAAVGAVVISRKPQPNPVVVVPTPSVVVPQPEQPKPGPVAPTQTAIAAGTPIQVRVNQGISSDQVTIGETFSATLAVPLILNGKAVVPVGADATIKVLSVDPSGKFTGQTQMQLALVQLASGGKNYKVSGATFTVLGPKQAVVTAEHTGIGGAVGAVTGLIGGKLFHHAKAGTAVGAAAGGGIGAATTKPHPAKVSPEQMIRFRLTKPLPVTA